MYGLLLPIWQFVGSYLVLLVVRLFVLLLVDMSTRLNRSYMGSCYAVYALLCVERVSAPRVVNACSVMCELLLARFHL